MSSCDLNIYEDTDNGEMGRYYDFIQMTGKSKCYDCHCNIDGTYYAYEIYVYDEELEDDTLSEVLYLCEDCQCLKNVFNLDVIGTINQTILDEFHNCYYNDFDIKLLDSLTPSARNMILELIDGIQQEE